MNNVSITGRCSSDVLKFMTQEGRPVVKFSLAFDSRLKKDDGSKIASFIECEAWDLLATRVYDNVHKGDRVGLTGHLVQHKFTRKDGSSASIIKIIISSIEYYERRKEAEETSPADIKAPPPVEEEDLPF